MQHKNRFLRERSLSAIVVLLLFCTISTAPAQTILPAEDIAEKALASTVYLEMMDKNGKTLGIGSGFFVKSNLIATNYHVIEGAARGTAKLVGKHTTYNIEGITATDKTNDLALLKVTAYGIKHLSLGDSDAVRIGETVYVAGNPKGLEGTFSDGIISSRRNKDTKERLQMTAPISPGSSGGPVLNRKGEVIGVSFMTLEGGQNLNFAIPSKYLKTLLIHSGTSRPLGQSNVFISAETYFKWGNAKFNLEDYKGAIAYYIKSLQLEPNNVATYNNMGNAKYMLGQHTAAIADYDKAIRLKPDSAEAYNGRGNVKTQLRQYPDAIVDFDTAIRLKNDYADAYNNMGNVKSKLGRYVDAIADFDTAIRLKPDFAVAYSNRGNVKSKLGQHDDAIADHNTAIRLKPDNASVYNNRGLAKDKLGQYDDAITDYNMAIRLKPDLADFYYNRGIAKYYLGHYNDAILDYNTAIHLEPDAADAYGGRGDAKAQLKQYTQAIADYGMAIQLEPDDAEAYHNRGVAKAMLGRIREAKQDVQMALKLAEKLGDLRFKAQIEETLRLME